MYCALYCICFYSGKKSLRSKVVIYFSKLAYLIQNLNGEVIVLKLRGLYPLIPIILFVCENSFFCLVYCVMNGKHHF